MGVQLLGFRAYTQAMQHFNKIDSQLVQGDSVKDNLFSKSLKNESKSTTLNSNNTQDPLKHNFSENSYPQNFTETVGNSLQQVNELQKAKDQAIDDFASGRSQNVHELMITMQKSSIAMKMTSAVRSKVLEAYKEIARINF